METGGQGAGTAVALPSKSFSIGLIALNINIAKTISRLY